MNRRHRHPVWVLIRTGQICAAWLIAIFVFLRECVRLRGHGREGRQRAAGRALLSLCTRLGATFIKIGQILSTRGDLLPRPLLGELAALQDQVPPFSFEEVRRTIEKELGRKVDEVYDRFDRESVAAGSVAQVHRAVLRSTGDDVAVKVLRPDVADRIQLDRSILLFAARTFARIVPSLRLISLEEAVGDFCAAVERQLDFFEEARSCERTRAQFAEDPDHVAPRTFPEASTGAVLTMEWLDGLRENELEGSAVDFRHVVRAAVRHVCRSIFVHGFLHADGHPGNVRFQPPGRIVVFDFGLMAELGEHDRVENARMVFGIATGDGKAVAKALYDQSPHREVRNYAAYEGEMAAFVADLRPRGLGKIELMRELGTMFDILRRHHIQARSHLTMVYVSLLTMEGLAKRLDPELSVFDEALPYLAEGLGLVPASPAQKRPDVARTDGHPESFAAGRYRVERILGEGGRKLVFLARDTSLDRDVAIAVLKTDGLDRVSLARFHLEARATAKLGDHPRMVAVYDFGDEDRRPFLVGEYMAGGTLAELIERSDGGRLPVGDASRIGEELCQALEHAHARGIVHRDLKPGNVWLTADGHAKLGDFGLSTASDLQRSGEERALVGTVAYMSPEQALGRPPDPRNDLYSLGCVLYEAVTGEPPFSGGDPAAIVSQHLHGKPAAPSAKNPAVPAAFDALVLRCLAKTPADRPPSAAAVGAALAEILTAAPASNEPTPLERIETKVFIGREGELKQLSVGLEQALAGRGRLFLIAGEPGIGKTRLTEQLAVLARRRGARVLLGRCHEGEGAPAFWPWMQILRSYIQEREAAPLEAELGVGAADLAQLVPAVHERLPHVAVGSAQESEAARFRLFDAITTFLKNAAAARPLVLVLDDIHWADKPSLLLIEFLARQMDESRLFVVATYRDVEVQHGHPLADVLPSIRRAHAHERVRLRGLGETDVRALLGALGGHELPPTFARAIHRESEGNPFFIEEILSHLVEEGILHWDGNTWIASREPEQISLPESVREVVGRRVGRLDERCRRVLTLASVMGREFDASVLERVAELDHEALADALAEANAARVIAEIPRAHGRFRFAHALIRETLYGELRTAERVTLHRKIAETLEEAHRAALEPHLAALAYHFAEAAPGGDVDKAVSYAMRAADQASRQLAFEEAGRHASQALQVLELRQPVDESQRCELLLKLGAARFYAGEFDRCKETFLEAARIAEANGNPEQLARAAVGFGGTFAFTFDSFSPATGHTLVPLLEKALVGLGAGESALRAVVMARLAAALVMEPRALARRQSMARDAVAMARRIGDRLSLATALVGAHWAISGPDNSEERFAMAEEGLALSCEVGDPQLEFIARLWLAYDNFESADAEAGRRQYAVVDRLADTMRQAYMSWSASIMRVTLAQFEGRFDEAEELIARSTAIGQEGRFRDAVFVGAGQMMFLQRLRGRTDVEVDAWLGIAAQIPLAIGRFALTLQYCDAGRVEAARRLLDELAREDFADLPRDAMWLPALVIAAECVGSLKDRRLAEVLYGMLEPYAGRCAHSIILFEGPVTRVLGVLATILERIPEAARHFEAAIAVNARMGALPWLALTELAYARMLLHRAAPGDRQKALGLLTSVIETAERIGMRKALADALALKLEAQGATGIDRKSSIDSVVSSLDRNKPDLRPHAAPDGTVTLLFSDMENFSAMTERLGDQRAHAVVRDHNRIVREELRKHEGYEVDLQGDGFLLAFSSARRGLQCAIAIQKSFATYSATNEEPIRVRIGLHTGEVIREANTFFGRTVILAARIAARARGGEILVSGVVRELTERDGELRFGKTREIELKGLGGKHPVSAVGWDGKEPEDSLPEDAPAELLRAYGNVFRKVGDFWTIGYEGRSVSMRDAKGLHYIATLLRSPGQELHALDLVRGPSPAAPAEGASATADSGHAGELLDGQARSEYKARVEDLRSELEEAQERNDAGRAVRLQEELDFISQELSAAYGLGGRARKTADASERARKAVASRVTDSITRLRKEHPALALHFTNAIRLGTFCSYAPEKVLSWLLS